MGTDPVLKKALGKGEWPEVPQYLQPAIGAGETPAGKRPWARAAPGHG